MSIPIGLTGRIIKGEGAGGYVKVIDDSAATGGLLILTSRCADMNPAHDNWVRGIGELAEYFNESGWVVEWLSKPSGH